MENPALWEDPEHAQKVSKEKKLLDNTVGLFKKLTSGASPYLRSGLSLPYFSMAVMYGTLMNGAFSSVP